MYTDHLGSRAERDSDLPQRGTDKRWSRRAKRPESSPWNGKLGYGINRNLKHRKQHGQGNQRAPYGHHYGRNQAEGWKICRVVNPHLFFCKFRTFWAGFKTPFFVQSLCLPCLSKQSVDPAIGAQWNVPEVIFHRGGMFTPWNAFQLFHWGEASSSGVMLKF